MQKHFFFTLKSPFLTKLFLFCLITIFISNNISAQLDFITIQKIIITGNKKTKEKTILRELDFSVGDTIHLNNLANRTVMNQTLLMNTGLFTSAKMNIADWNTIKNEVTIKFELKEFWFIYPFPIVELSDRNFNEWWQTYNHDLNRINIGLRFYHINLTGRNDLLKLVAQFGFTKKYEAEYHLSSINKKQTIGIFTNGLFTQNKALSYAVANDTLRFFRNREVNLLQRVRGSIGVKYRPALYFSSQLNLSYHHNTIDKKVALELNPYFFKTGLQQRYFSLEFEMTWDKRDIRPYPMKGYQIIFGIKKDGFDIFKDFNAGHVRLTLKKYFLLSKKWSAEFIVKGQMGITRSIQPFYGYKGLGYGKNFIRGYELYVINGLDYTYAKTKLRFELINFIFEWGKIVPIRSFRTMPIKWYLTFNNDVGFVNDPFFRSNNNLRNKLLWGGGIGLDIVTFYDKVFHLEYSINRLGERGFFLNWQLNF